jgi:hypothetical protein
MGKLFNYCDGINVNLDLDVQGSTILLGREAMFDGILDNRLQNQKGHFNLGTLPFVAFYAYYGL